MSYEQILRTHLVRRKPQSFVDMRRKRIEEALNWRGGTRDAPIKHLVTILPDGTEVFFLKPGKEVFNIKRPKPYDMTPCIGNTDRRLKFDEVWTFISRISVIDFDLFKAVLTLIYRNAFLIDHQETKPGIIRYQPSEEVIQAIREIEETIGDSMPSGLYGLLHFLDVLGWNEDVKYHTDKGSPTFKGNYGFNVGRINTLLTCIRVPYQASSFVRHVEEGIRERRSVDFMLLYTIMQQFAKSRGTCTPTNQNLLDWLAPYIIDEPPANRRL